MWHRTLADASFLQSLVVIDDGIADVVRRAGCIRCDGRLYRADYPRKPRGLPDGAEEAYSTRRSLCCGSCRKRTTPPSVRFLGRKVYAGWLVFVATIRWVLAAGLVAGSRIEGVPRRTVRRWRHWWTAVFPTLPFWLEAQGLFMPPPPDPSALPVSLTDRFEGEATQRLRFALAFVAPTTTFSASWVRVDAARAEDGI